MNKEFWNERYGAAESAYGEAPNVYFKEQLEKLNPAKLLLPCEGEGRNAVFAAVLGWEVDAFDLSEKGKEKADQWAADKAVAINFQVCNLDDIDYPAASYDAIALLYTHFQPQVKQAWHQKLMKLLKPGGIIILEGFSKDHLKHRSENPKAGGPPNTDMLYSIAEIKELFPDFEILELAQIETTLDEGLYHQGLSSVVRFLGKKTY